MQEMSLIPPVMVPVTSIKAADVAPSAAGEPVHDDRDFAIPARVENANWGIPPQNDSTE